MITQILKPALFLFIIHFTIMSCTKPVDFYQAYEAEINPVVESSLFYFNATASDFVTGSNSDKSKSSTGDSIIIGLFNNEFVNDNLIKIELVFETANSINMGYETQVDFLDDSNKLLHTFTFLTQASPNNIDIITQHIEVFEGDALASLTQATQLDFKLTKLQESSINSTTPGETHLISKAIFYLNITQ